MKARELSACTDSYWILIKYSYEIEGTSIQALIVQYKEVYGCSNILWFPTWPSNNNPSLQIIGWFGNSWFINLALVD